MATQVELALKDIQQRLRNGDGDREPTIFDEFHALWQRDFAATTETCATILGGDHLRLPSWETVHPTLEAVSSGIRIKIINGSAADILDYEDHKENGIDLIAVGGDKLSRGLTLEGLSVSYFLRASRMYDTLMQMGRWFGYREKYIDVCRLYTTTELLGWFAHIAAASEELQRDFERMVNVGATPREYGHKVRSHPAMLVTSAVKMRNGTEMRLSFSGSISETTSFKRDDESNNAWIADNFKATEAWLKTLGNPSSGNKEGGYTWTTGADQILEFLREYRTHDQNTRADTALLSRYIKTQREREEEELVEWTVRLVSSDLTDAVEASIAGMPVGLIKRAPHPEPQRPGRFTIRRIVNPADESLDLTDEQRKLALELTIANWERSTNPRKAASAPTRPNGAEARQFRDKRKALLLIYPLDPERGGLPKGTKPIIGLALSFPKSDTAKEITYTVNNVFTSRGGDDDSL